MTTPDPKDKGEFEKVGRDALVALERAMTHLRTCYEQVEQHLSDGVDTCSYHGREDPVDTLYQAQSEVCDVAAMLWLMHWYHAINHHEHDAPPRAIAVYWMQYGQFRRMYEDYLRRNPRAPEPPAPKFEAEGWLDRLLKKGKK